MNLWTKKMYIIAVPANKRHKKFERRIKMGNPKNVKNKNKKAQLNIRLSQVEKRRLERKAMKSGLNLSEYIRGQLSKGDGKRQDIEMVSQCVILCQDILNIIQEKYNCEDNSLLEEKVEKLWKRL